MATWEDRNERAREAGYRNYYDYRIHDYGALPPDSDVTGEELAAARGHRSEADLSRMVGDGDLVDFTNYQRNSQGQFEWVEFELLKSTGEQFTFRLQGYQLADIDDLIAEIEDADAIFDPHGYFDK